MEANATDTGLNLTGHCYCGAVCFEVNIPAGDKPIFAAYCHCDSCRRAHAAPLYHVACVDAPMFKLTAGEDTLKHFQKPGSQIERYFCGECGSKVCNRFPGWNPEGKQPVAFFPSLLEEAQQHPLPELLRPAKHNRPEESVLDVEALQRLFDTD